MQHVAQHQSMATRHSTRGSAGSAFGGGIADGSRHTRNQSVRHSALDGSFTSICQLALAEKKRGNARVTARLNVGNSFSAARKKRGSKEEKPALEEDEDEDEEDAKMPRCIIMPDSNFRALIAPLPTDCGRRPPAQIAASN